MLSGCGTEMKDAPKGAQNGVSQEISKDAPKEVGKPSSEVAQKTYSLEEVAKHNTKSDCWTVVNGKVADVTGFFGKHPGGDEALLKSCGVDASEMFASVKKHDPNGYAAFEKAMIGTLN